MESWLKKIGLLKKLLAETGPLWPNSTKLAGYAEDGPYHCEDCTFLKGKTKGEIFKDGEGRGRCNHPVMISDPETEKDKSGLAIVNIEKGCCEFVTTPKKKE